MPYNYLFDMERLQSNKFELGGAVVLVDEAHNIDQQAQEGCSFCLSEWDVRETLRELQELQKMARTSRHNLEWFRRPLLTLQRALGKLPEGITHIDTFDALFTMLKAMTADPHSPDEYSKGLGKENLEAYLELGAKLLRPLSLSPASDAYMDFLRKCLATSAEEDPHNFSIYSERSSERTGLNVNCLTSSLLFRHLTSMKPLSIILASGTLQPLHYWQQ